MTRQPASASSPSTPQKATDKPVPGPGRPKDLGKRAAILDAAKRLFVSHGYLNVSMDQIAAEAGVSKLTVYSHFGDKETLFSEAIRSKCSEMLPADLFQMPLEGSLREQLLAIARAFFALVGSDEALALHRVMLTQTDEPLRQLFWQSGPQAVHDAFADFLRARIASGELVIDDADRAAHQFFVLAKGHLHNSMLCGLLAEPPLPAEVDAHLQATVDFFLRAYAPR